MPAAPGFGQVLIPGERGRECRAQRLEEGIRMPDDLWDQLQVLAGQKAAA